MASSTVATEEPSCLPLYRCDAARRWTQVKFQAKERPLDQGSIVTPSGRRPSFLMRPVGSNVDGMQALFRDYLMTLLPIWWRVNLDLIDLHIKAWEPCSSALVPHTHTHTCMCKRNGHRDGGHSLSETDHWWGRDPGQMTGGRSTNLRNQAQYSLLIRLNGYHLRALSIPRHLLAIGSVHDFWPWHSIGGCLSGFTFALQCVTAPWNNTISGSRSSSALIRSWQDIDEQIYADEAISVGDCNPKPPSFTGRVVRAHAWSVIVTFVILSNVSRIICVSSANLWPHLNAGDVRRRYINFGMAKQFFIRENACWAGMVKVWSQSLARSFFLLKFKMECIQP